MNDDNNDGDYDDDCDKDDACYCDKQVVVVLTKMILAIIITTIIITSPIITTIIGVVLQSFILEIPVRKSFYKRFYPCLSLSLRLLFRCIPVGENYNFGQDVAIYNNLVAMPGTNCKHIYVYSL